MTSLPQRADQGSARDSKRPVHVQLRETRSECSGSFGRRLLGRLDARHAVAPIDAHRNLAIDGGAAHDTVLVAVVVDGVVLRGAVVPDRNVALLPAPAHGVFGCGDV